MLFDLHQTYNSLRLICVIRSKASRHRFIANMPYTQMSKVVDHTMSLCLYSFTTYKFHPHLPMGSQVLAFTVALVVCCREGIGFCQAVGVRQTQLRVTKHLRVISLVKRLLTYHVTITRPKHAASIRAAETMIAQKRRAMINAATATETKISQLSKILDKHEKLTVTLVHHHIS